MDEQYKESGEPKLERPHLRFYQIKPFYRIAAVAGFLAICLAGSYLVNASTNRLTKKIDEQTQRIDDGSNRLARKIEDIADRLDRDIENISKEKEQSRQDLSDELSKKSSDK